MNDAPRHMTRIEMMWSRIVACSIRLRRRLPYVVWYGAEIDVRVTMKENRLRAASMPGAVRQLYKGSFYEAEKHLIECGITFDKGLGPDGRDWEWDWSLAGPISVTFRGPASKPDRRQ